MSTTSGLNVIALISGGKDSLYSLLHCLENGHKLTALANLYPSSSNSSRDSSVLSPGKDGPHQTSHDEDDGEGEQEDLNSFMYQTVGYSVIPLYAECLGLPLYRRAITGSAVQTGRYYDSSDLEESADETEDLIPLLQEIKRAHPEASALCSGAILSTYQRTRVESIAVRLGLTPLAYLWQYPALPPPVGRPESLTGLLEDMASAGCDARVIKIASGGIPESLLWANVADPRTRHRLVTGLAPFFPEREFWLRGAVLGEGGEYETLAVNGPRRLWRKRIEVPNAQREVLTLEGGVSYVKLGKARVVEQDADVSVEGVEDGAVPLPGSLDEQFRRTLAEVQAWQGRRGGDAKSSAETPPVTEQRHISSDCLQFRITSTASTMFIANITIRNTAVYGTRDFSAKEQMEQIVEHLEKLLTSQSTNGGNIQPTPSSIVSTTLLLKNIADFAGINIVYASLFRPGEPNPPARVTFACDLPAGTDVSLSVVLSLAPRESRRGLHVQSRSYWAPANIGPYSQAICQPLDQGVNADLNVHDAGLIEIVHIAGQIPLVPQSMDVLQAPFLHQAVLSLQHLWRVGQERGIDLWPWGISFLEEQGQGTSHSRAEQASKVWQYTHRIGITHEDDSSDDEDQDGPDAWDLRFNRSVTFQSSHSHTTIGAHLHTLPNPNVFTSPMSKATYIPSFIAATVTALPRNAPVEWWSLGLANLPTFGTSRPCVKVVAGSYDWGNSSAVTITPTRPRARDLSRRKSSVTTLVTIMMNMLPSTTADAEIDSIDIEKHVSSLLSSEDNADTRIDLPLDLCHGTAFISSEGERQWMQVANRTSLAAITVVPCTSLFGSPAMEISKESSEFSYSTRNGERHTSDSSDVSCQPLSVALTLRIEHLVDTDF
ncbi:hypothetical protein LTR84_004479 [Exophiala bonariae]|uniref:Diphthine--ammonia ligase n=1 Tax=Exophiala bonariae TaxID=1690606 RepID=A0AAV9N5L1_9EURO|nr:hypothetical protein LTR84_004479 [Exophiala bonariae]